MKKKLFIAIIFLVSGFIWWFYSQNDERKIKRMIKEIETTLISNKTKSMPATFKKVKKVGKHFYPTAQIIKPGFVPIQSRRAIEGRLLSIMRNQYEIENISASIQSLKIEPPQKAFLKINLFDKEEALFLLHIQLKKEKSNWFIDLVQIKDAL